MAKKMIKNRRVGIIHITREAVDEDPGAISSCFHLIEFVPVEISYSFLYGRFEYLGISPKFTEVSEGACAPVYTMHVAKNDKGKITEVGVSI